MQDAGTVASIPMIRSGRNQWVSVKILDHTLNSTLLISDVEAIRGMGDESKDHVMVISHELGKPARILQKINSSSTISAASGSKTVMVLIEAKDTGQKQLALLQK